MIASTSLTILVIWMRQTFGGVPRPTEVLVGFPALIVGVSLRSRRREGWWVLVFAVLGTVTVTTSLVSPGAYPTYIALSTLYSVVLGVVFGGGRAAFRRARGKPVSSIDDMEIISLGLRGRPKEPLR